MVILFWVDDLIIASDDEEAIGNIKHLLFQTIKMKDLGKLSWFLGVKFDFEDDCVRMNQTNFIERVTQMQSLVKSV